jgi:hypothetical protein
VGLAPDVDGAFTSAGHNLIGKNDGSASFSSSPPAIGDKIGTLALPFNPLLGPLADNGGLAFTMALLPGSPAIDAGDDSLANNLATDQRGFSRKSGPHVDIGAFELQATVIVSPPLLGLPVLLGNGALRFGFSNAPGASFSVLASTNVALPLSNWINLGPATQGLAGQYLFTDPTGTNFPQRYYRVISP